MNLTDFFDPAAIAAYWSEIQPNLQPYRGSILFPPKKKAGLDLSWLRGSRGLPVSLMPSDFDAKATFRDRIGFQKLETEMPFFREGFKIKEKDRQEILRAQDSDDPYVTAILERMFDDAAELISGANVVPERMIFQLLFPVDGDVGISIKANGVNYTYSYDTDGAWKTSNYIALSGTDKWDQPKTADPFATFKAGKDAALTRTGAVLTTAMMNTNTFNKMAAVEAIKTRYLTTSGLSFAYMTGNEVKAAISNTSQINIVTYDNKFRDEDKVTKSFVPDGYVCMIPDGTLGSTWYGTTPEEADLMSSSTADVSIVNTGVALSRIIEEHPVNINTYASEIVMPSYERMDDVVVIKVY